MSGGYNLPWFPAWGIEFDTPIGNLQKIIYKFNEIRPSNRWLLVRFDSVASEFHLWSTWISVVTKEINDAMIAKSVDVEFQRLLSGNRQISKAFEIVGLSKEYLQRKYFNLYPFTQLVIHPNVLGVNFLPLLMLSVGY